MITADLQKLAPGSIIDLYELDATNIGSSLFRWVPEVNELNNDIVWQGNTYSRFPIEVSGFARRGKGTQPRPTIRTSNIGGLVGVLVRDFEDMVGAKFTRRRTFVKYLDAVNFAPAPGAGPGSVNLLVVAGGGGGGDRGGNGGTFNGGGGGAGGLLDVSVEVASGSHSVTIGAGGGDSQSGADSVFGDTTAKGGGKGASGENGSGGSGGSGGGGSGAGGTSVGGASVLGQGNDGGVGSDNQSSSAGAGGGGGASQVGGTGNTSVGGDGGDGVESTISGSSIFYAGGGGGSRGAGSAGSGGQGGGGNGGSGSGGNAALNSGGGGGGAWSNLIGGTGGSGVVIISFPIDGSTGVSTTSTGGTITTVGGNQIHTFTSSGTFTPVKGGRNPQADPNVSLPDEIWFVDRKASEDGIFISFELASAMDLTNAKIPKRQVTQNVCAWQYRSGECGYTGGAVADITDNPTSDISKDVCGHRVASCKLRFGANSPLPYGGFSGSGGA